MEKFKLPSNVIELAKVLGLTENDLQKLAHAAPNLYHTKREPKKRGGFRIINPPFKHLKDIQKKILRVILNQIPVHRTLHSGPKTSTKSAAKAHVKQPVVVALDVQDFFPSVQSKTVCGALEANGFSEDVASLLARLTTHKGRLPQGAPTSPAIARIVLCDVCKEFEALLNSVSPYARATIYVDDITISGPVGLERLIPAIISIFKRHGYSVNPLKKKIMTQDEEQIVLGLRVNRRVEPSSEFNAILKSERQKLHPRDPKLKGLESYKNYITRGD
jgi:RNA-directed DNA polymerase